MSGRLPAGGCDNVSVANRDGLVEKRSMVYTEYFVRGTEPAELCPLHSPSFTDRLAGIFGKEAGVPVSAHDAGLPPPSASTSGTPANPSVASAEVAKDGKVEEPKKKRGFWGRIFGGGDDEAKKAKKEEERKREEERKAEERRRKGG